jgi:hypothetical protein
MTSISFLLYTKVNDNRISGALYFCKAATDGPSAQSCPWNGQTFSGSQEFADHWRKAKFNSDGDCFVGEFEFIFQGLRERLSGGPVSNSGQQ